ncbi:MAG: Hsp20/alpha crystallin family protein [Actinomycetota bacterium]
MVGLLKREPKELDELHTFDRFDQMFDDWMKVFPLRRMRMFDRDWMPAEVIRVDEFHEDGALVVKAELPGIDPDKDVEVTVVDGMLHIEAERREEEHVEKKGYLRHELRCGSFTRTLPLPEGVSEDDVKAEYKDGILEIRVPAPEPAPPTKVPIAKS